MPTPSPAAPSFPHAPEEVWQVGFSGHRELEQAVVVREALARWLEGQKKAGRRLVAVSSFADGADRLFIEEALGAGLPWIAVAPFPEAEDMKDLTAASALEARDLLKRAAETQWPPEPLPATEAYEDMGVSIVQQCDVLLVVWDGGAGHGAGGTAANVEYARLVGRPVVWLHSVTGKIEDLPPAPAAAPGPHPTPPTKEEFFDEARLHVPEALLKQYEEQDALADSHALPVRKSTLLMVLLEAAGTLSALASLTFFEKHLPPWTTAFCAFLKVFFVGWAVSIAWRLRRRQRRQTWAAARMRAELCRSAICSWPVTGRTPELKRLGSEPFLRYTLWLRSLRLPPASPPVLLPTLAARTDFYRRFRICDQLEGYYRPQALRASRLRRRLAPLHDFAVRLALVLALAEFVLSAHFPFLAGLQQGWKDLAGQNSPFLLFKLLPVILTALATWAITWMAVAETARRERRYTEMVCRLEWLDHTLARCKTESALRHLVAQAERLLLNEVMEWHTEAIAK